MCVRTSSHACAASNRCCPLQGLLSTVYAKARSWQRGEIQESMQLFQAARASIRRTCNLKQVGRSFTCQQGSTDVRRGAATWDRRQEIRHGTACNMYLKQYETAADCFRRANAVQRHDTTYMQLGKVFTLQEDYRGAIDVYLEALEFSPENPELLTTLGLIYPRLGENDKVSTSGNCPHDPKNPKTILAAGRSSKCCSAACRSPPMPSRAARARAQDHSDMDVALVKHRVAAVQTPNSAQLWNNIGMCFFGKQRCVASRGARRCLADILRGSARRADT